MTVGKVIALLAKYCSDDDYLLMCRNIYSITVYTIDGNSADITISEGGV